MGRRCTSIMTESEALRLAHHVSGDSYATLPTAGNRLASGTCNPWSKAFVGEWSLSSDRNVVGHLDRDPTLVLMMIGPGLFIDGCALVMAAPAKLEEPHVHIPAETWQAPAPVTPAIHVSELRIWTKWSDRKLAKVLGTTHPTVARLARNETSPRSSEAIWRLRSCHDLLLRLHLLVGDDQAFQQLLMAGPPGRTVGDLLEHAEFGAAYRAGLEITSGGTPEILGSTGDRPLSATFPADSEAWV